MLFDVDSTLVYAPHNSAFAESIKSLHGLTVESEHGQFAGLTDQLILSALLHDKGWDDDRIKKHLPALVRELERLYITNFIKGSVRLVPGIKELLVALSQRNVVLGLMTGNLETIAKTKLEDVGIWHYFSVGGFGSDPHTKRSEIVQIAIQRSGMPANSSGIYIIGDTPRDIEAAREAGITHKVGLASGGHSVKDLKQSGADIILSLDDLKDTHKTLIKLGVLSG